MKTRVAIIAGLLSAGLSFSATQRPSMIVHGVIRDSYGLRLGPDAAMVSAYFGTNEVARTATKTQPAGANYRLDVNVVDPLTAGPQDLTPGATVAIRVRVGAVLPPTIGTNTFTAQGDGSSVNINLTIGVDSDQDGLPDDWERMVIANSGGAISDLSQVGPGRDLDGDGVPDDVEFLNGTFAFLPDDLLRIRALAVMPDGRLSFSFTSVDGAIYSVDSKPTLETPEWTATPVSLTETGPINLAEFTGNGQVITIYFAPAGPTHFYRLKAR